MERFTLLVNSRYADGIHAMQIMAESREGVLQYIDGMEINPFAIFRESDVELLTYLYYRVCNTEVYKWMKGIIYHAALDKPSYWIIVDDDSELEDDNLLSNVRKVVMVDQKHRQETFRTVYPEYLHEMGMDDLNPVGLFDEIEQATPEEAQVHERDYLGDLDEDDATLTDEHGYMTVHVCDCDGDNVFTFRVPVMEG